MDISVTEEQKMLKTAARDFLKKECPGSMVREIEKGKRGYSPELWRKMAQIGWLGTLFPEEYGGSLVPKGSLLNMAIIMEEMGYAALPSPFFSTVIGGGLLILEAGSSEQKSEFLPRIANGELIVTLAFTEPNARFDASAVTVTATPDGSSYIVNGTKLFVLDAHIADYVICVTRTCNSVNPEEGITLFIVDCNNPSVRNTLLDTSAERQCEVTFQDVRVSQKYMLGALNHGWIPLSRILQRATALKCIEMVGGAQASLDMSLAYAKIRVQFGKPIGSFQAVHHHCADMYKDIAVARLLSYQAVWRLDNGLPATKEVSFAKAKLSKVYPAVTTMAHQIHGGVGFTADYDLGLYYRRALTSRVTFGDANFHYELISRELRL